MKLISEGFVLGIIFTSSLTISLFFLKFWVRTRDLLFLAFAFAFFLEAAERLSLLFIRLPNIPSDLYYFVRMTGYIFIIAAVLKKNYEKP